MKHVVLLGNAMQGKPVWMPQLQMELIVSQEGSAFYQNRQLKGRPCVERCAPFETGASWIEMKRTSTLFSKHPAPVKFQIGDGSEKHLVAVVIIAVVSRPFSQACAFSSPFSGSLSAIGILRQPRNPAVRLRRLYNCKEEPRNKYSGGSDEPCDSLPILIFGVILKP